MPFTFWQIKKKQLKISINDKINESNKVGQEFERKRERK